MLKLALHLIPETTWYQNLRKELGSQWKCVSYAIRARNQWTCQYCGWQEDRSIRRYTQLHEIWEYDTEKMIQRLIGFECLCPMCHKVHHWGGSKARGEDMDALMKHACKINNCTPQVFRKHIINSFKEWEERSKKKWTIDTSKLQELIADV